VAHHAARPNPIPLFTVIQLQQLPNASNNSLSLLEKRLRVPLTLHYAGFFVEGYFVHGVGVLLEGEDVLEQQVFHDSSLGDDVDDQFVRH